MRRARESTPSSDGSPTLGALGPDTDLDVLMRALLGASAPIAAERDRHLTDVESRLAEVVAAVGLTKTEVARAGDDGARATKRMRSGRAERTAVESQPPAARIASLGAVGNLVPAIRTRLLRWLRLVSPVLLMLATRLAALR